MNEYSDKLMSWQPSAQGFSSDDVVLAVGLQCRSKRFPFADVLTWLGTPDKGDGDAGCGHLVYFYVGPAVIDRDVEVAYMFDVTGGLVVDFGSIARYKANAFRPDGKTPFNILDEMSAFDEVAFKLG